MSSWKPPQKVIDIGLAVWAVLLIVGVGAVMTFDKGQVDSSPAATFPAEASTPNVQNHHWTFDDAKKALAKDNPTVLVLGDSTGNDDFEWVRLWAEKVSENREVEYHPWDNKTNQYGPVETLGSGGRKVTIWNGSHPGATAAYPIEHWDAIGKRTDLAVLSFGHNGGASTYEQDDQLSTVLDAVLKQSPKAILVGTAQNPQKNDANRARREAVVAWDKAHGLPTIDVNAAFAKDGRGDALRHDDVHPNEEGAKVWFAEVERVLGDAS